MKCYICEDESDPDEDAQGPTMWIRLNISTVIQEPYNYAVTHDLLEDVWICDSKDCFNKAMELAWTRYERKQS